MRVSSTRMTFLFEFNTLPSWPGLTRPPTKRRMQRGARSCLQALVSDATPGNARRSIIPALAKPDSSGINRGMTCKH